MLPAGSGEKRPYSPEAAGPGKPSRIYLKLPDDGKDARPHDRKEASLPQEGSFPQYNQKDLYAGRDHPTVKDCRRRHVLVKGFGVQPTEAALWIASYSAASRAVSRATSIISVKLFCRSSALRASPVKIWSEMVSRLRARLWEAMASQ